MIRGARGQAPQEVVAEETIHGAPIIGQGMTNLKSNAIIVISLVIMLQIVDLLQIMLRRANYASKENQEDQTLLVACKGDAYDENYTWVLDTGASNHTCGMKEKLVDLDE